MGVVGTPPRPIKKSIRFLIPPATFLIWCRLMPIRGLVRIVWKPRYVPLAGRALRLILLCRTKRPPPLAPCARPVIMLNQIGRWGFVCFPVLQLQQSELPIVFLGPHFLFVSLSPGFFAEAVTSAFFAALWEPLQPKRSAQPPNVAMPASD